MLRLIALVVLASCGDDDARVPIDSPRYPDAQAADAPVFPDAHECFKDISFFSDEGGEVWLEYRRFANGDAHARAFAFFIADDDVDFHDYPNLAGCTDMRDDTRWPAAQPQNGNLRHRDGAIHALPS